MNVLLSPHNDDETLFAAFTIAREHPRVVVCFPGAPGYGDPRERTLETRRAVEILGGAGVEQWTWDPRLPDTKHMTMEAMMRDLDRRECPRLVWAPDEGTTHPDDVAVYQAASAVFGDRLTTYHTYRVLEPKSLEGSPHIVKVTSTRQVHYEAAWVGLKLRALAEYQTQLAHPRAFKFFMQDLREWYGREAC